MTMKAIAILTDKTGRTIGARLQHGHSIVDYTCAELKQSGTGCLLENAIIDKNGRLRAKSGNLPKLQVVSQPSAVQQGEILKARKLVAQNSLTLYHGNKDPNMYPAFGKGKANTDYGVGFYTTPDKELGKEWAWSIYTQGQKAFLHQYRLDIQGLSILDFTQLDSIHWFAELLSHRPVNVEGLGARSDIIQAVLSKFKFNTQEYDVIIGYRADDSYYRYVEAFLSGAIYKEVFEQAIRLGNLGLQVCLKSQKAFDNLEAFPDSPVEVPRKYEKAYLSRLQRSDSEYNNLLKACSTRRQSGLPCTLLIQLLQ